MFCTVKRDSGQSIGQYVYLPETDFVFCKRFLQFKTNFYQRDWNRLLFTLKRPIFILIYQSIQLRNKDLQNTFEFFVLFSLDSTNNFWKFGSILIKI